MRSHIATFLFLATTAGTACAATPQSIDASTAGLKGDGTTLNTAAIQALIDTTSARGGGIIAFPAGRYLTGTIELKSNVTLRLAKDAVLVGSTDPADYRNVDPFIDGSGNPMGHALVVAVGASNVGIEGEGTIDGQGPKLKARQKTFAVRPFLVRWVRSSHIAVRGVRLENPGAWTLNFFGSNDALVDGITIRSRGLGLHNNDGINIDSSEHIQIRNCDVDSGDDALVIKSTGAQPSRDIRASDSKLSSHTNAIKLGTESYGGFEDIAVTRIAVSNTDMAGIALYNVDGGFLRNVTITDVTMDGVAVAVSARLGSRLKTFREGDQPRAAPGVLRDVRIANLSATNIRLIGLLINGVPGHPVENLSLEHVRLTLPGGGTADMAATTLSEKEKAYPEFNMFGKTMPAYAAYIRHARGVKMVDFHADVVAPDARPAVVNVDVEPAGTAPAP